MKTHFIWKKGAANAEKLLSEGTEHWKPHLFPKHASKEGNMGCDQQSYAPAATLPLLHETKTYQNKRYGFINTSCIHNKNAKWSILFP